jgi:hypothetical protein
MDLDLDETQATALLEVIDSAIADLSPEIADTDNAEYRSMLRQRRELLRSIQAKLVALTQAMPG